MKLLTDEQSHEQSLNTLNALYEYDDFMESVESVIDLGCGSGKDLEWWATRTTRDAARTPLNIRCTGVDLEPTLKIARDYSNVTYQKVDFEGNIAVTPGKKYDVLWSHNAFQYALTPLQTLVKWREITNDGGMLVLILPQTTNYHQKHQNFWQHSGSYYHYSLVNLIQMLAVTGWDCRAGFFLKDQFDPWLHAVVYNSNQPARDPRTTTWYELAETNLLPESAVRSVMSHGYLKQQDLLVPWLDHSLHQLL